MTKKLLAFLIIISVPFLMNAQCGPSYSDNASPRSINNSIGISFTIDASCGGTLTNITIDEFNDFQGPVTNVIVRLYAGNGTSGSVIGELTNISLNSNNVFDFSGQNISMTPSAQYTVIVDVSASSFGLGIQYGFNTPFNAYTGGSLYDDEVEMSGLSIDFAVNIDNSTLSTNNIDISETSVHAYPNPAKNNIQITALQEQENYAVFNIYGKKVLEGIIKQNETINIKQLTKGVYFIRLNKKVLKFIKE